MNSRSLVKISLTGTGILAVILIAVLLIPVSVSCSFSNNAQIGADKPPVTVNPQVKALNDAYVAVSDAVVPQVVSIGVVVESKSQKNPMNDQFKEFFKFFGEQYPDEGDNDKPQKFEASGSGVFITEDGYIVTNNHVVENAVEINVTTHDKKEYKAKLIGRDPLTDLALIKVEGKGFSPAHFGNGDNVKVGDIVFAVGNPMGLTSTVTSGIVSAIGRGGLALSSGDRRKYSVENFVQTDAPINPGNSGGGLFNLEGSLIGINTAIATRTGTYIGYGFAIPINLAKSVLLDLMDDGKINRGYIGVEIRTIDELEAKSAGLDKVDGVMINNVLKDSPAEKAGVEVGDIILELDGQSLKTSNDLQSRIAMHHANDVVKLTLWRDGKKIYKSVKLEPKETDPEENKGIAGENSKPDEDEQKPVTFDKLGFAISPITKDIKKSLDVKEGALITKVDRYSKAAERGLAPNGVIVKVDRKSVSSPEQVRKIIDSKKSGDIVMLQVKYNETNRIVAIQIP